MQKKFVLITLLLGLNAVAGAKNSPTLTLSSSNVDMQPAIILKATNTNEISNLKFNGIKNFSIIGREVTFTSSSEKNGTNEFTTKLLLQPIQAGTSSISVSAEVNKKQFTSNTVNLSISSQQLKAYNAREKKIEAQEKLQAQQLNKQIIAQIQEQQKFFDSINHMMQKQEAEMLKQQQELIKAFN